jgi:hypothetical protein
MAMQKWLIRSIVLLVALFISVIVASQLYIGYSLAAALRGETDSKKYEQIREQHAGKSTRKAFFPRVIPQESERVAFFFRPAFGQGSEIICLRLQLSNSNLQKIMAQIDTSQQLDTELFMSMQTYGQWRCYPPYDFPQVQSNELLQYIEPLPSDFQIFLQNTTLDDTQGNHGHIGFIAVSKKRLEIVYFAEGW